nr:reverse transcriptase domain-containing protein [Tanacetum cinerariifolium]
IGRALIDVYGEELTLRIYDEEITFNVDLKAITTRSGVTLAGPSISPSPSKEVNREPETITDQELTRSTNNAPPLVVQPSLVSTSFSTIFSIKIPEVTKDTVQLSTENIQPPMTQFPTEPVVAPKPKPTIPYPSRANKQKLREKDGTSALPRNIVPKPRVDLKAITTWSGVTLAGPAVSLHPFKEVDLQPETIMDQVLTGSTNNVPPLVVQLSPASTSFSTISSSKMPEVTKDTKLREKDDNLALKFVEIFRNLQFEISFADALLHMAKFALMFKSLLYNKEKLFDLATTPVNENCSAVILKKLPEKLGDPGKFFIPCDFPEFNECLALADLGASINLMPLSIWKNIFFPELTYTQMILQLANRSTTRPAGIAEDVFVKVGKFHFPTDFVVVDYVVDPRIPLILGRTFLRTERALIDVYGEELTLRVDDEAITFKVGQTLKYSYNDAESINRIDVIDVACEEYVQEGGDFILEEIEACLTSESIPLGNDDTDLNLEGDIRLLEELLNNDPSLSPLPLKELNVEEIKTVKSSIDDPPELELKDLLSHLENAYLEGTDKLPVIIAKCLKDDEKEALLKKLTEAPILVVPDWNLPSELMCDASDFAIGAVLGQLYAFEKFQPYLVLSKSIVYMDHSTLKYLLSKQDAKPRFLRWVLLLREFDIIIRDKKGTKNLAADHLSRHENPHKDVLENKDINENFPLETLGKISSASTPWIAPDLEDSRARGFDHLPLKLQSFAYGNPIS